MAISSPSRHCEVASGQQTTRWVFAAKQPAAAGMARRPVAIYTMIKETINTLHNKLPAAVKLVAVSKFHPFEAIEEAYAAGQRIFAESRPQELLAKVKTLQSRREALGDPDYMSDIEWHFIGHLQTNKIKYMAPYVAMIHGVDSFKLLVEIDKQAAKAGRIIPCLLQIHIAQEETKFGFSFDECREMLEQGEWKKLKNITLAGVMGMGTFTDDREETAREFQSLGDFFLEIKQKHFADEPSFKEISMGMSDDYPIAIEHGSTLVRVGSRIFGERNYLDSHHK